LGQFFVSLGTSAPQFSQKKRGFPPSLAIRGLGRGRRFHFRRGRSGGRIGSRGFWSGFSGFLPCPALFVFVGYVKPGALKNDACSSVDEAADILPALGTGFEGIVAHVLKHVENVSAIFTFIFIGWHIDFPVFSCIEFSFAGFT
jgi:hypothetical protein